jgi:hypothetical protein
MSWGCDSEKYGGISPLVSRKGRDRRGDSPHAGGEEIFCQAAVLHGFTIVCSAGTRSRSHPHLALIKPTLARARRSKSIDLPEDLI